MDPLGLSSRADQTLDTTRSWAVTHDDLAIVWASSTPPSWSCAFWLAQSGPRLATRCRGGCSPAHEKRGAVLQGVGLARKRQVVT